MFYMPSPEQLLRQLEATAQRLDLKLLGWTSVEAYQDRFPGAHLDSYLPGAASVIVLGELMLDGVVDSVLEDRPRFIRDFWSGVRPSSLFPLARHPVHLLKQLYKSQTGDFNNRYHFFEHLQLLTARVNRASHELAMVLEQAGHRALPVDPCKRHHFSLVGVLSLKHAAALAGLGQLGRHQQLIVPGCRARVWLGGILTSARLSGQATPVAPAPCEGCNLCVQICPLARRQGAFTFSTHACRNCSRCLAICPGWSAGDGEAGL